MARRGRGRGRGAASSKRKLDSKSEEESPTKLKREDSYNTELRKAIEVTKVSGSKKKVFKVDDAFPMKNGKIFQDYSAMLNQTNIGDNNNKFYVIQVIESNKSFFCFTKWGRVGESGMQGLDTFSDSEKAVAAFKKKFKDKTKNDWDKRDDFTPHPKKYTMLEIDEESDDEDETDADTISKPLSTSPVAKCQLDARTALMIKLIFNKDMFVSQMADMNLDVKKMPLGKLSKSQIAKGLEALLDIEKAIKEKKTSSLAELSSKFYTLVPHNFGRSVPPIMNNQAIIDQKKELMITLSDIELTQSLQKGERVQSTIHPLDEHYDQLGCKLELIDKKSSEFKMLQDYAKASSDTRKGPILDAWKVDRNGEDSRFNTHNNIKHRKLLWHGTKVAVVAAVLNSGLRIMPHSGGRVGRGIYFASEHRKSSWYVGINYGDFEKEKNIGFMFLVEAALGKESTTLEGGGGITQPPKGFDSVVARGLTEPDPKKDKKVKFDNHDVIVPLGKPIKTQYTKSHFGESEYLVYKESQARMRYLLKFSFAS